MEEDGDPFSSWLNASDETAAVQPLSNDTALSVFSMEPNPNWCNNTWQTSGPVLPSGHDSLLFVGCLPPSFTKQEMEALFQIYGQLTYVNVLSKAKSKSGHTCGFVSYAQPWSGDKAIASLNGLFSLREGDLALKVIWALRDGCSCFDISGNSVSNNLWEHKTSCNSQLQNGNDTKSILDAPSETRLLVGNLPPDVAEDVLDFVFSTYGNVVDIRIFPNQTASGQSAAFVSYATIDQALTAILSLHDKYEMRAGDGTITVKHADVQTPAYS